MDDEPTVIDGNPASSAPLYLDEDDTIVLELALEETTHHGVGIRARPPARVGACVDLWRYIDGLLLPAAAAEFARHAQVCLPCCVAVWSAEKAERDA